MVILISDLRYTGFFIWHRESLGMLFEKLIINVAAWATLDNLEEYQGLDGTITRMIVPLYIICGMNLLRVSNHSYVTRIVHLPEIKRCTLPSFCPRFADYLTCTSSHFDPLVLADLQPFLAPSTYPHFPLALPLSLPWALHLNVQPIEPTFHTPSPYMPLP
jgi:hypothetical protein